MSYRQQYQYYNNPQQTNQSYSTTSQRSQQSLQQQPFIPQQQNPYVQNNQKNQLNLNQMIPKSTSNPFTQQVNIQQSQKGPQFLFSQEQSNVNQPVAQKLLNKQQYQQDPKILQNQQNGKDNLKQAKNNKIQNDEEELEYEDVDYEENQQEEEDDQQKDDTEQYDTEEEIENQKNIKQQVDVDKYKSVTEIDSIRKEVNKINKELDKLDQELQGTLIMSRINFGEQTVLDISASRDLSYQQYLKEFEQFKQQKQVNPRSMNKS
ncbi:unnamed protein product (macronuclear) [Paramecium tetraurelia]|uniref:Uncharacterized protein n=1 Tax=Paramecium tetraurelia TaxID=5888 RepID=A0E016_PARTE|nr:uncharacterized protein GSPATT00021801001 [Paramecium tetraurelia]CAK88633.1 unnamed protein product [Paramecium tetraurelia]|eukprot:XP_001456030.1 hypothetical protein (macronuclear) [Paramecium tetraurelia strain d4-2]